MEIKDIEAVRCGIVLVGFGFLFTGNFIGAIGICVLSYGLGVFK
jgi:hypothetical protein